MRPWVKICGITNAEDARAAVEAGADALGFVFARSPRAIDPEEARPIIAALPPFVVSVGVFVDAARETVEGIARSCGLQALQFQGRESPEDCEGFSRPVIKGFKVRDGAIPDAVWRYRIAACLFDAYVPGADGGTGRTFDWALLRDLALDRPVILAGGLTPENVAHAVAVARPDAVDVSSGVALGPRKKDPARMAEFVRAAKQIPMKQIQAWERPAPQRREDIDAHETARRGEGAA